MGSATHNRAGEITYTQVGTNTFEVILTTYTRIETDADRPIISVDWGDGTLDTLDRDPGFPQNIDVDIRKNVYTTTHVFPGPGSYIVSIEDPNRNAGVNNIPNSVNVPFYIESKIIINPFLGNNSSPILLNPPIDDACVDAIYQHNPGAFDSDGDSLVYSLVTPRGINGDPIAGYGLPPGTIINSETGTVTWDKPTLAGEFNIAILIQEFRNGFEVGNLVRDMQITVGNCNNQPPVITAANELCVVAGTLIDTLVTAYDPDSNDVITLSATGGAISQVSGNQADFPQKIGIDSVKGVFSWQTGCNHVRKAPYTVLFKAEDNGNDVQLIDIHELSIKILGPPVKNVNTTATTQGINVNWTRSICPEVVSYQVYRKIDSLDFTPDSCSTGIAGANGYSLIGTTNNRDSVDLFDNTVVQGNNYCYRIVAIFPDGAESIVSEESCAKTIETAPIPLKASVQATSSNTGVIEVKWRNPINLDSLNFSGMLSYNLYTVINNQKTLLYSSTGTSDTTFTHADINTEDTRFVYQLELIENNLGAETILSTSKTFSSIFAAAQSADRRVILNWNYSTPWTNDTFIVFREQNLIFEPIDTVFTPSFEDDGLTNGTNYCYKILAIGKYASTNNTDSILNFSQEVCAVPEDLIPPCVSKITDSSNCIDVWNTFRWQTDTLACNGDLATISVYYKRNITDNYILLYTTNNPFVDTSFIHTGLQEVAGCYAFTATDSVGNESALTNEVCFDNCPVYELPNIFTPNGDNFNELVQPFPYQYIESIEITIFNRWGQQVYKTNDINVNWDGKHELTKLNCSSGVYYYVCTVNEQKLNGIEPRTINGFIHLMR